MSEDWLWTTDSQAFYGYRSDKPAMVKVTLDISDENYEKLKKLGTAFNQSPEQVISGLLEVAGYKAIVLIDAGMDVQSAAGKVFDYYFLAVGFLDYVPIKLGAEGKYGLVGFSGKIDEGYFNFNYDCKALDDDLVVDSFDLTLKRGELDRLTANTYVDRKKVSEKSLERLKAVVTDFVNPFDSLEDFSIRLQEDEDIGPTVIMDLFAKSMADLLSLKEISATMKKILKKAEIKLGSVPN